MGVFSVVFERVELSLPWLMPSAVTRRYPTLQVFQLIKCSLHRQKELL